MPAPSRARELAAQPLDLTLADLVRQGLARPGDVAVGLDRGIRLGQAGVEQHADAPVATPAQRMDPRVHDQPRGAPCLRGQHPEPLGIVAEEPHLAGQPLRVETPALGVRPTDQPRAEASEGRQIRVLHLQRDLEVVARHGLVIGGRAERGEVAVGQVIRVHVVDPRPRPVDRRRVVVRERRILLHEGIDRSDVAGGNGQATEPCRRCGQRPVDVFARPCHQRFGARGHVRRVSPDVPAVRVEVVPEAGATGDRPAFGVDLRELVQAHLVELDRVELERGPRPDREPVQRVAVRGGPQAGILARRGPVRAPERVEVPRERRPNVGLHGGGQAFPAARVAVGQLGGCDDRRLGRRDGEKSLGLGDRAVDGDARRGEPAGAPLGEQVHVGIHVRPIRLEPRHQPVEPVRRVRALELDHLGEERLGSAHLVDRGQQVRPGVRLLQPEMADHVDHVARDALLHREAVGGDRLDLRDRALPERPGGGASGWARIVEEVRIALIPVDRGRRRRLAEEPLPEAVGEGVDGSLGRGHADRSPCERARVGQASTTSARMARGSLPCRSTSSWKRRMSKAAPSRRSRSRRRRWISRRPVR